MAKKSESEVETVTEDEAATLGFDKLTPGEQDSLPADQLMPDTAKAADHAARCEAAGLNPAEVAEGDPALTGVPRDERHDSIDPHTGVLSDEAQRLRRERAEQGE